MECLVIQSSERITSLWLVFCEQSYFKYVIKLQSQQVCSPNHVVLCVLELNSLFLPKLIGKDFIHV